MILSTLGSIAEVYPAVPALRRISSFLRVADQCAPGRYDLEEGCYATIKEGTGKALSEDRLEAHRNYLDLHLCLMGAEKILWGDTQGLQEDAAYSEEHDIVFYRGRGSQALLLTPGLFCVFFPGDGHEPNLGMEGPASYRKAVVKIPVRQGV